MTEIIFICIALIIGGIIGYIIGDIKLRLQILKKYEHYSDYNAIQTKDLKDFITKI